MRQRDVVIDKDDVHLQAKGACAFCGQTKIQPVARVVLDDQQAPGLAGHGQDASQHRVNRGRGENIAADSRCQHPLPDKSCMCGFVARAAARDQCDLGSVPIGARHHADVRIAIQPLKPAAGHRDDAVNGLLNDVFSLVDELGHGVLPYPGIRSPLASKKNGVFGFMATTSPARRPVWASVVVMMS